MTPSPGDHPANDLESLPQRENFLLRDLTSEVRQRLMRTSRLITFSVKEEINSPGDHTRYVYFPVSGMYSTTLTLEEGSVVEVGGVGSEGLVGLHVFYGFNEAPAQVVCQIPGRARAMRSADFARELKRNEELSAKVRSFAFASSVHTMQLAACNRIHSVEKRLARWLLTTRDRVGSERFPLTQQFMAFMVGSHRPRVTLVAQALQNAGHITYERGVVTISDHRGLEDAACRCYQVIKRAFEYH